MHSSSSAHSLAILATLCSAVVSVAAQRPVAISPVGQLSEQGFDIGDVSPVFLTEQLIALFITPPINQGTVSQIVVLRWTGNKLTASARTTKEVDYGAKIFSVSDGRILVSDFDHQYLYSSDLSVNVEFPSRFLSNFFPRSATIGEYSQKSWKAFRVGSSLTFIRAGQGILQNVSNDIVLFLADDLVHVKTLSGKHIGLIPGDPGAQSTYGAETAGPGRIFLNIHGHERIVDLQGKELTRIHSPDGWGFRHGWSTDGGRMLFDHFIRTVSPLEKLQDFFREIAGAPIRDNGEAITVLDTVNGKACFSLESPLKKLGPGRYHADLSPSGRWVVVSTLTDVSVYRLPDVCGAR